MLLIELAWPPRDLSPNARVHRFARARALAAYRLEAAWSATAALRALRLPRPEWKRASVNVLAYLGPRQPKPDADNILASLKAAFDGLQDAGIVRNDRGLELGPVVRARRAKRSVIWLVVREISTALLLQGISPTED